MTREKAFRFMARLAMCQRVCRSGGWDSKALVSIRIGDDGPGFPNPLLSSAAERFERETSHGEGTGLELSIAAAIAEAHGGSLRFANRRCGGAAVVLCLPNEIGKNGLDPTTTGWDKLDPGA